MPIPWSDPAPVNITTRSGDVRVVAEPGAEMTVEGGTIELGDDGAIHIRRMKSSSSIEVHCAPGTDVTIGTVSGKVRLVGALGAARVATVSGTIRVDTVERIDVRTKSGKIDVGTCTGECRVMSKSSSVHIGRAGHATVAAVSGLVLLESVGGAEVKSISGKVLLSATGGDRVSVHTVSGQVEITVPAATRPATRLRSISGDIRCELTPGADFDVAVASVSGAIRVSSA